MTEVRYTIPDMNCAHCKTSVESSLNGLAGVESSEADPQTKLVEISYDETRVGEKALEEAIKGASYTIAT